MRNLKTKSNKFKSKKGFTLIELLAVIVILAIIAMIAVPTVLSIIEKARKGAFRNSVYGLMEAADIYLASENTGSDEIEFVCDGISCAANGHALEVKGTVPLSGSLKSNGGDVLANFIRNGEYCALGTKNNLDINKDCNKLDYTPALLDVTLIKATSKSIVVQITATDTESNIKKITYKLTDATTDKVVDKEQNEDYDGDKSIQQKNVTFDDLESNHQYKLTVTATNGNNQPSEKTMDIATRNIDNPTFTVVTDPTNPTDALNGYLKSQTITVNFDHKNTPDTAKNYIKTSKKGTSSVELKESCEVVAETGAPNFESCASIGTPTKELEPNKWYVAPEDLSVTYSENSDDDKAALHASTYDGKNYNGTGVYTLSKIDATNPTLTLNDVTQKTNSLLIPFTAEDTQSGIGEITCKYGESADSLTLDGTVTDNSCSLTGLEADKNYYYQVCAEDKVGNKADCQSGNTKTKAITNPVMSSTKTPATDIGGYVKTEVITVTFGKDGIDSPKYYIKSTKTGTTNNAVLSTCTNNDTLGTVPNFNDCTPVSSETKSLNPNTWYEVSGDIQITYNEPTTENGNLNAVTYDGKNYKGSSNQTLLKIFYDSANVTYTNTSAPSVKTVKDGLDYIYGKLS